MYELIIIGGGPAGSAAAITAAQQGTRVLLLERGRFPRHKVCGEFVSPESLSVLHQLLHPDGSLLDQAPRVSRARFFLDGKMLEAALQPPAAGISRFDLDQALWQAAERAGVDCRQQITALEIAGAGPFELRTSAGEFEAGSLIDCSGRWSNFTVRNGQPPPTEKWIGLKGHFVEPQPSPSVDLYFFAGGYCGIEPVNHLGSAERVLNVCAMVRSEAATTLNEVFALDGRLQRRSNSWRSVTGPVTTSPLLFGPPLPVREHALLAGDAAGFIDPFVGDGISLALRSGVLAAQTLAPFWRGEVSLTTVCKRYERAYRRQFLPLFRNSQRVRRLLSIPSRLRSPLTGLVKHTGLPEFLVRTTRGTGTV